MNKLTIEQEKEQALLCVAWLATVNMHMAEERSAELDPDGKRWDEDEAWDDSVEDAKEEALEEGAYLFCPAEETMEYVKSLKSDDLWMLYDQVDTKTTKEDGTVFVKKEV